MKKHFALFVNLFSILCCCCGALLVFLKQWEPAIYCVAMAIYVKQPLYEDRKP